jgi:hypothetical protein
MDGGERARVGLCAGCAWAQRVVSGRGSVFWLCGRSRVDARFRKYPPLPVRDCPGFEASAPGTAGGRGTSAGPGS